MLRVIGGRSQREADDREKRFILNLRRMSGITSAVTPDAMFEFCVHVQNANIADEPVAPTIEEQYLSALFSDADLDVPVCSVEVWFLLVFFSSVNEISFSWQYLISRYEKAKEDSDEAYLRKLKAAHQRARVCLDNDGMKSEIRQLIQRRVELNERIASITLFEAIFTYIRGWGSNSIGRYFARTLPQVFTEEHMSALRITE